MVAEKRSSYEEIRQRTIEENKKKLEELDLSLLTKSLRETASPKPYPVKQVKKRKIDVGSKSFERRWSGRLSDKPAPNYRDAMLEYANIDRPRNRTYKRRDLLNRVYASDEARHYAIKRAQEIENTLGPDSLTFVKAMLQSHTTGGFWLKNGLSAGWRGFAIEHELVDGDAVVFHLVNQITFKVYIVRQSAFAESKAVASAPPKLEN
ncbi:hypothetical protein QJS10_CPA01g01206 [Acorus calamus]|uniref:TF-B3 domain-containing protein n=1 Tax=Acorus calamus TaxID=4465 RepID=A0AAV9FMA2_ACOCL|nr:hypothetical protein QJS10_CPA01g01206 [Acorus calamus]